MFQNIVYDTSATIKKVVGSSTPSASGDDRLILGYLINTGSWQQSVIEVFGTTNNTYNATSFNTWQLKLYIFSTQID